MTTIKLTAELELREVQFLIKKQPECVRYLVGAKIQYRGQDGMILATDPKNGLVYCHFCTATHKWSIDFDAAKYGNFSSIEIERTLFQRITYTNIIVGGSTAEQAKWYLTTVVDRGLIWQLKKIDVAHIFTHYPELIDILSDHVLDALKESSLWDSIPPKRRFQLFLHAIEKCQPEEIPNQVSHLTLYINRESPIEYWRKIPRYLLERKEIWPEVPEVLRCELLFCLVWN